MIACISYYILQFKIHHISYLCGSWDEPVRTARKRMQCKVWIWFTAYPFRSRFICKISEFRSKPISAQMELKVRRERERPGRNKTVNRNKTSYYDVDILWGLWIKNHTKYSFPSCASVRCTMNVQLFWNLSHC